MLMGELRRHINESDLFNDYDDFDGSIFDNPFDNGDAEDGGAEVAGHASGGKEQQEGNEISFKKISIWNSNVGGKTVLRDGRVYAGRNYSIDDTIEEAPVRILGERDMYSDTIRDMAFMVDPVRRVYAIPLGYASCYRTSGETGKEGNVDYEFDPNTLKITIYALKSIHKGDELILLAQETDYVNALKPGQFQYGDTDDALSSATYKAVHTPENMAERSK